MISNRHALSVESEALNLVSPSALKLKLLIDNSMVVPVHLLRILPNGKQTNTDKKQTLRNAKEKPFELASRQSLSPTWMMKPMQLL